LVTPKHIVPEWYFLPFYLILKLISVKWIGILAMIAVTALKSPGK
jgi:quinol-cytochrome oxidoreductase complex cytochrome b subunit